MRQPRIRSLSSPLAAFGDRCSRRVGAKLPRGARIALPLLLTYSVVLGGCAFLSDSHPAPVVTTYATSTPAFASQGPLAQVVVPAIWGAGVQSVVTTADQAHGVANITITLSGTVPNTDAKVSAAQALAKGLCFMAEQAVWTSGTDFSEVKVDVEGPVQDEYGSLVTSAYAVAVVESHTGHTVSWATTNAESAWQLYDSAFIRDSFVVAD